MRNLAGTEWNKVPRAQRRDIERYKSLLIVDLSEVQSDRLGREGRLRERRFSVTGAISRRIEQ